MLRTRRLMLFCIGMSILMGAQCRPSSTPNDSSIPGGGSSTDNDTPSSGDLVEATDGPSTDEIPAVATDEPSASGGLGVSALNLKLPFRKGETWKVTNAYGEGGHTGRDAYALDFTLDECAAWGKPILAVADGVAYGYEPQPANCCCLLDSNCPTSFGRYVIVKHQGGYVSWYGHLSSFSFTPTSAGVPVKQGQEIGQCGNAGCSCGKACYDHPGTHLHLRVSYADEAGNVIAAKPEPMSGITGFKKGRYTSDNELQVYQPPTPQLVLSIFPAADQSANTGSAVTFTCLVTTGNGAVISGASIPVSDAAGGLSAVPLTTDNSGQASYTSHPFVSGQVCFGPATKTGYTNSSQVCRQITLNSSPPVIADVPDVTRTAGQAYTGPTPTLLQGTSPINWTLPSGPSGMTISSTTGVVTWSNPTVGTYAITIQASNSVGFDNESWTLTVSQQSLPPVIADIPDASRTAGQAYTGPAPTLLQGTSPINWTLPSGPSGMTISSTTGVVTWSNPTVGTYTITIRASNSVNFDDESWALTVTTTGPAWKQMAASGPSARYYGSMAYAGTGRVLLYGGQNGSSLLADTWLWDGSQWQDKSGGASPQARTEHAMSYAGNKVLLFGGLVNGTPYQMGDTWQWNGSWSQLSPANFPEPRTSSAVAFDSTRGLVWLFGGERFGNVRLADTWYWDASAANWSQVFATGPAARRDHMMTYDALRDRVVLVGGNNTAETWEFNPNPQSRTWSRVQDVPATIQERQALIYNDATKTVVLFAGYAGETWEWDGQAWKKRIGITNPNQRYGEAAAYDSQRQKIVLFGGVTTSVASDLWEYGTWP